MQLYFSPGQLGNGSFGVVYMAWVTSGPGRVVALKKTRITNTVAHPGLLHEACALTLLSGHPSIPEVYAWGRSQYYEYLALEILGYDLERFFWKLPPSMKNLVAMACQMLDAVEYIHSKGIVHCDIKPSNFMFGCGYSGRVYLTDFGHSTWYRDPETQEHLPEEKEHRTRGTRIYASINYHLHIAPSRRDDMASLAYTLLQLLIGVFPWTSCKTSAETGQYKQAYTGAFLCQGHPPVFGELLDYSHELEFAGDPDYARFKHEFRALCPELPENPLFDFKDISHIQGSVGTPYYDVNLAGVTPAGFAVPSASDPRGHLGGSWHGWEGQSEWHSPRAIAEYDMFGDELEIVLGRIDTIDEVPKANIEHVYAGSPPEVMLTKEGMFKLQEHLLKLQEEMRKRQEDILNLKELARAESESK